MQHVTWRSVGIPVAIHPFHAADFDYQENYGSVLRDCSKALSQNPKSTKAYYRSAMALVALDRLEEAIDCCTRCLEFDKDNEGVLGVLEHAAKSKATKDKVDLERKEKLRQELLAKAKLDSAFKVGILPQNHGGSLLI